MNKLLPLAGLMLLTSFALPFKAGAAVIFQDNFNGYTVPGSSINLPASSGTTGWSAATNNAVTTTKVFKDTGNIFGSGTANQYLQINRTGTSSNFSDNVVTQQKTGLTLGLTGQASFTFIVDSSLGTSTTTGVQMRLAATTSISNASSAYGLGFTSDGLYLAAGSSFSTYTLLSALTAGQVYNLSLVYNFDSTSTYTYSGGTVAAASMDVWLDTGSGYVLVGNDLLHQGGLATGTTLETFGFINRSAASLGIFSADNVLIDSVASVPEPSAAAGLSLGLATTCFVLARRRRKNYAH